jgi:hypothetical protein
LRRSRTKRCWVTFYNEEVERALKECFGSRELERGAKLSPSPKATSGSSTKIRGGNGVRITPQVLRELLACEMRRLGFLTGTLTPFVVVSDLAT